MPASIMGDQGQGTKPIERGQRIVPIQQNYLFVDAAEAKTSRKGRRNARSFLMQKARRERPWSTSKEAARQRTQGSASPRNAGASASTSIRNTASSSPATESRRHGYFQAFEQQNTGLFQRGICANCRIFVVKHDQTLCPKCIVSRPTGSVIEPGHGRLDPFGSSSLILNEEMSELLNHCKLFFNSCASSQ